jgi:hypothetical protein
MREFLHQLLVFTCTVRHILSLWIYAAGALCMGIVDAHFIPADFLAVLVWGSRGGAHKLGNGGQRAERRMERAIRCTRGQK